MNRKTKILIGCALAFLLAAGAVAWCFLPHPLNYPIADIEPVGGSLTAAEESPDVVTLQKNSGGDWKILLFTDLHLDGKNKTSALTVGHLVENIRREKPDLVLLCGDNVTSAFNRTRCKQLGRIFEKLGVYWAGVLGNHEGDNRFSVLRSEMAEIFSSFEHCLLRKGLPEVTGNCNYSLRLLNADGSLCQIFYFLDTFDMLPDGQKPQYGFAETDRVTDGAHADQIAWYRERLAADQAAFGTVHSVMLLHIPLPQVAAAAETGDFLYGGQLEGVCCTGFDAGLFDAIKQGGSTSVVFCGHDHLNNFGAMYDGVLLSYIEPSGYGSYTTASRLGYEEKDWLQGYTRLTVSPDGAAAVPEQFRNSALA